MNKKTVWIIVIVVSLLIIGGLIFYLISRPKPSSFQTSQPSPTSQAGTLPSRDVAGVDLEVAPRYPGSVRTEYSKSADGIVKIMYVTKDSTEKVKSFYSDKMATLGWQMSSSEEDQVRFEKEPARLYVWLDYNKFDQITSYELRYFPE